MYIANYVPNCNVMKEVVKRNPLYSLSSKRESEDYFACVHNLKSNYCGKSAQKGKTCVQGFCLRKISRSSKIRPKTEKLGVQHMSGEGLSAAKKIKAPRAFPWAPQTTGVLLGSSLEFSLKNTTVVTVCPAKLS